MEPEEEQVLNGALLTHENRRSDLIAILIEISEQLGFLPRTVLINLARRLNTPLSEVFRVATFYAQFRFHPPGKHQIMICQGTACHVRASSIMLESVTQKLGIIPGETTSDRLFSLDRVACFGACALAPVAVIDNKVYGGMTPQKVDTLIETFRGA